MSKATQSDVKKGKAVHTDLDEIPLNERRTQQEGAIYKRSIYALPVSVQVVIGSAKLTIAELLQLQQNSLITLDSKIDDPVDLCINDRVIARGELIEVDPTSGKLGVKLSEIVDISDEFLQ